MGVSMDGAAYVAVGQMQNRRLDPAKLHRHLLQTQQAQNKHDKHILSLRQNV